MLVNLEEREGIQYFCKLLYEAFRMPVFVLDASRKLTFQEPSIFDNRPAVQSADELLAEILNEEDASPLPIPVIRATNFLENFIVFQLPPEFQLPGTIIMGPVLYFPLTEDLAARLMRDNEVPLKEHGQWLQYYHSLAVLDRTRVYHAAMLLYSLVTGKALSVSELFVHTREPKSRPLLSKPNTDLDVSYRRENTWLHHDPLLEREFFRHIKNGNKAELLKAHAYFSDDKYGLLSRKSHLRSKKNLAISTITLATRAAIDGGLFWEIAYTLSDFHIQHIEELKDIHAVDSAQIDALCDFADHVRGSRRAKLSRTVALCQNYIFNHLYEDLSLEKLAGVAGLNGSYLSQLFRKETGMTLSDYIQRERIEEAKNLMEQPGISLSDIASRLHFNDQSYFTKVFKKFTGTTPRQFRNNRGITL